MESDNWEDPDYAGCEICGPKKCMVFTEWTHDDRPMAHFLEWLLRGLPQKQKTYVYSHNGARYVRKNFSTGLCAYSSYDMQFAMHGLYARGGRPPKITNNGLKLMQIELRGTKTTTRVVFRDSCLLFPMKLDDIPETFAVPDTVITPRIPSKKRAIIQVPRKPYFPYKANSVRNYDREMYGLPSAADYLPNAMSVKKREHFEKTWYPAESARRKHIRFDIKKEAVEYCNNDTLQLLYGVVHFRKLVNQVAAFDVFSCGMTITALTMRIFKVSPAATSMHTKYL